MARDPARIDRIINKLRVLWHAHPDLRLGQLVSNLSPNLSGDSFYVEDDVMEDIVDRAAKDWEGFWTGAERTD